MAQETSSKLGRIKGQLDASQLKQTFNRISEMEQRFQSLKSSYVQNMKSLADKIMDAQRLTSVDQKANPNPTSPSTSSLRIDANPPEPEERFDGPQTLQTKIKKLAKLIQKSKHFVAFTGSGISPASECDDSLGSEPSPTTPISPVLDAWAKNLGNIGIRYDRETSTENRNPLKNVMPNRSHMALTGLMAQEPQHLKYIISENNDAFHRESGVDMDRLIELHDSSSWNAGAFQQSEKADLYLVLGSTLHSFSAAHMAEIVSNKWHEEINNEMDREPTHHLVIINPMKTEFDQDCALRIFATVEDVMMRLMHELQLDIPHWNLQRFVRIQVNDLEHTEDVRKLSVCGVDADGGNIRLFKSVELRHNGQNMRRAGARGMERRLSIENLFSKRGVNVRRKSDRFVFHVPKVAINDDAKYDHDAHEDMGLVVEVAFMESYTEPRLAIEMNEYLSHLCNKNGSVVLKLLFDPINNAWDVGNKREQLDDASVRKLWVNYENKEQKKNKALPNPYELAELHGK